MKTSIFTEDRDIRLLTFQSYSVLDTLMNSKKYLANSSMSREGHSYCKDKEQLDGFHPIYAFKSIKSRDFSKVDFLDGSLLHRFRCEMSINTKDLGELLLLDITKDKGKVKKGLTHNCYSGAVIVKELLPGELNGVYSVGYGSGVYGRMFPNIKVINIINDKALFMEDQKCEDI